MKVSLSQIRTDCLEICSFALLRTSLVHMCVLWSTLVPRWQITCVIFVNLSLSPSIYISTTVCLPERCQSSSLRVAVEQWNPYERRSFITFVADCGRSRLDLFIFSPSFIVLFCVYRFVCMCETLYTSVALIDKTESSPWTHALLSAGAAKEIVATNLYDSRSDLWTRVDDIDQWLDYKMTLHSNREKTVKRRVYSPIDTKHTHAHTRNNESSIPAAPMR